MPTISADFTTTALTLPLADGQLTLTTAATPGTADAVTLYFKGAQLVSIDTPPTKAAVTRVAVLTPPATLEVAYLARYLAELATTAKLKLEAQPTAALPANQRKAAATFWQAASPLLALLGITIAPAKKQPAKAQHRFKAAVAKIPFTTDFAGTQATVYWQKRNELRLLAGAKMLATPPLNADGSLGFSARFANQLRQEHADAFDATTFTTTKDLVLKSVNELGLFLYFGGTNSWLVFKDADGKSIHEWTVVA